MPDVYLRMVAKRPRVTRTVKTQTGRTHISPDRKVVAMHPGMRVSKSGKPYFENRKNRSDKSRKRRL
jgi:hypothetical protein